MTLYSSKIFLISSTPPVYVDSGLSNLFQSLKDYFSYRKTFRELNALTDRELEDIGLTRGNILAVASGKYHR